MDDNTQSQDPNTVPNEQPQPVPEPSQGQTDDEVTQPSALPQDNGTPFQPASDTGVVLPDDHPATDDQSNADSTELQDAGAAAASGVEPPASDSGVGGFTPPADEAGDVDESSDQNPVV
jgi:hypothetical protein